MLEAIIPAVSSVVGGLIGKNSQEKMAEKNIAMQREFAQNGISWKVADAKKSGIHPLYALGAQTHSFSPISMGGDPLGAGVAQMGQDIGRAMMAGSSSKTRDAMVNKTVQDLQLSNMGLQNELLAAQIAKLKGQVGPPLPIPEDTKAAERPQLYLGGNKWLTDPTTANQEEFAKRYGDEGPVSWLTQALIGWRDVKANWGEPDTWADQLVRAFKRAHPIHR